MVMYMTDENNSEFIKSQRSLPNRMTDNPFLFCPLNNTRKFWVYVIYLFFFCETSTQGMAPTHAVNRASVGQ